MRREVTIVKKAVSYENEYGNLDFQDGVITALRWVLGEVDEL